jgi:hypothetical protein
MQLIAVLVYHILICVYAERKSLVFKEGLPDAITRVQAGHSVVLECEAGGRPVPTVHWLHKGSRIPQVCINILYTGCYCTTNYLAIDGDVSLCRYHVLHK